MARVGWGGPMTPLDRLKLWARGIKIDIIALSLAARDPRTPRFTKVLAILVVAYALSPLDLIPDFIPVLGYLDDLILVPLGILLVVRLIPAGLMSEFRTTARNTERPVSRGGLVLVVAIWLLLLIAALAVRARFR